MRAKLVLFSKLLLSFSHKQPYLKAIIIGSGIAGISAAIRLASAGFQVEVFESNSYPGGKLTAFYQNGFRFDAGPSLFTLPELVDELFILAGKNPRNFFRYEKVDVTCNYFYEDGTNIRAFADKNKLKEEIDSKLGGYGSETLQYLQESARIYELTSGIFLKKSLHRYRNYLSAEVISALVKAHTLHLRTTMNQVNEKYLKNGKLVQLFNRYATYNGSSPYQAPGILTLIPHLEFNIGTFFPEGGMHQITLSLVELAESLGVTFYYEQRVDSINTDHSKADGIHSGGKLIPADIVVSNMDIVHTYRKLLPGIRAPRQVIGQERSSSALIFYWNIRKNLPRLYLHNIFFTNDYEAEFESIFSRFELYHDPTVYVHISSKQNPEDAPEGMENWFVMINVPSNIGQDWDLYIRTARDLIIGKISRMLGEDISPWIIGESLLEPRTIESRTSSYQGSLYGASSNHWLSAFIRHPNFHSRLKGLYFCGGSVHPGGGIPLSILSGKIVSDLVKNDYGIK
ncbi:MAG: phytoene desaturase [Cyclobacteriaceae bacterium]|nr:phytoene desaturase [Cyclobacteriaceae bacterium]